MRLHVLTIASKVPAWVQQGWQDYATRLPRDWSLQLRELRPAPRDTGKNLSQMQKEEGDRLLAAIPSQSYVCALDEKGQDWNTLIFSQQLQHISGTHRDISFLIGGPDGLSAHVFAASHQRLRLSSLTFAHAMVRVILAEQLYRAWSVLANHPYHRE